MIPAITEGKRTASARPNSGDGWFRTSLYIYLIASNIVGTILWPLRTFEVWNAAYFVYINIGFIAMFVLAAGGAATFIPRHFFQILILACFLTGALVGLTNVEDDTTFRNYVSHGFQLISAYVMYSVGRVRSGELWHEDVMRLLMLMCITADLVGTALIYAYGFQLGLGGYLVGVGSSLLALCYFLPRDKIFAIAALATILITGKRGPIVAALLVVLVHFVLPAVRQRSIKLSFVSLAAIGISVVAMAVAVVWIRPDTGTEIVELLESRLESIPTALVGEDESTKLVAAGGRYEEVSALTDDFTVLEWLVGRGFGYTVGFFRDDSFVEIHQAHFTPASLVVRFGTPLALLFLGYIIFVFVNGLRLRILGARSPSTQPSMLRLQETLALYTMGQLVVSLTAFTLFIDLTFFLFVGSLAAMASKRASSQR